MAAFLAGVTLVLSGLSQGVARYQVFENKEPIYMFSSFLYGGATGAFIGLSVSATLIDACDPDVSRAMLCTRILRRGQSFAMGVLSALTTLGLTATGMYLTRPPRKE